MPCFSTKLDLEYIDGREWLVKAPLAYFSDIAGAICVPGGEKTDFASVPRFFHRILPPTGDGPNGRYGPAAVIHDHLYTTGQVKKEITDLVFLEAMECLEVAFWRRVSMYYAVKFFGAKAWNDHRKQDKKDL